MVKYCVNCGKSNEDYVKFCEYCGHEINNQINNEILIENQKQTFTSTSNTKKENSVTNNTKKEKSTTNNHKQKESNNQADSIKRNRETEKNPKFTPDFKRKNPTISVLLSAIIIGSGYIYLGYNRLFISIFCIGGILFCLSIELRILLILLIIFYVFQLYGVYSSTKYYNEHNGKLTIGKKIK